MISHVYYTLKVRSFLKEGVLVFGLIDVCDIYIIYYTLIYYKRILTLFPIWYFSIKPHLFLYRDKNV